MAKQSIGIGTTANDSTGDTIRDAFDKCNDNFTELYDDKADATDIADMVATTDIIDDVTTGGSAVPLSAAQGVALKALIDANVTTASIIDDLTTGGTAVPGSAEQLKVLDTAKAPLASPALTGTPTAPTAATTTDTTQVATTAFVQQELTAQGLFSPTYGIISVQGGVTAETTVDGTARRITAWNTNGISSGVTVDHTDDSILVSTSGTYKVDASVSFSGTNSKTYDLEIYYYDNSADQWIASGFASERKLSDTGDVGTVSISGLITLETNDKVLVYQSTSDSGTAMTVSEAQLSVIRIA